MSVLGVVADTHCEPGSVEQLPQAVLAALAGTDAIVHCGDIIDGRTLDQLATVAPVIAVRSPVDPAADHERLHEPPWVIEHDGVTIGLLSRPADLPGQEDLARGPRTDARRLAARATAIFGQPVDVVLYRGSHGVQVLDVDGVVTADPGSPTCWDGRSATVGRLHLDGARPRYEVVDVTRQLPWRLRYGWPAFRLRQDVVQHIYAWRRAVQRRLATLHR